MLVAAITATPRQGKIETGTNIGAQEVRLAFPSPVATKGGLRSLEQIEKEYIIAALKVNGGNQTHTAEQLEIGSATLYRKLKRYGMIGDRNPLVKGARRDVEVSP